MKVKRLLAGLIDFYIICFLCTAFIGVITWGKLNVTPLTIILFILLFVLLQLIKDCVFKNASIGKRIFKIKIIKTDETKLTLTDIVKRNIPFVLFIGLEVIILVFNYQRLGDVWAKTLVVNTLER